MKRKDKFSLLLSKMSDQPDTIATFDNDEKLQAHAAILRLHSPVLAHALELAQSSSNSSSKKRNSNKGSSNTSSSAGLKVLPLPGTSKAAFLVVAQFLHPMVPLPKVSWGNCEVLLLEGCKWDIQVVLAHAADFLQANASSMDLTPTSTKYAFKWLQLADAARLTDACKACADRILSLQPNVLKGQKLEDLSRETLLYVVEMMGRACPRIPRKRKFDYCFSSSDSDSDFDSETDSESE